MVFIAQSQVLYIFFSQNTLSFHISESIMNGSPHHDAAAQKVRKVLEGRKSLVTSNRWDPKFTVRKGLINVPRAHCSLFPSAFLSSS